jgi:isoquinoline 1-oxidoreductase subunit beta
MSFEKKSVNEQTLTRRTFLAGSVGSVLVMGFGGALLGSTINIGSAQAALAAKQFSPTVWFDINQNGMTTIYIAKAEMGQHVGTALARIVADELRVNWSDVRIKHVDSDPKWGYMVTGGSWSVFTSFNILSQAGAAGRTVLLEQGAKLLKQPLSACKARDGWIMGNNKKISYADIVKRGDIDRSFSDKELESMPIMPPAQRRLVGKTSTALDIPAKVDGSAKYGIDVELPGMVYARPLIPPTRYGSQLTRVDDSAAKDIPGYLGYQHLSDPSGTLQGWVAVMADNHWSAVKAADVINAQWSPGPTAKVSEKDILAEGERLTKDSSAGFLLVDEGDVKTARANAKRSISSTYTTATALHFQMEPVNATVELKDGVWHIHAGNQWQSLIIPVLAKALATTEENIVIHQYYLGGGFGRRLFGDYMIPAALTAKAIGKPVKMVFTRSDDSRFDCVRSASVQYFSASTDDKGRVTGIEHAAAAGWPTLAMAPGFMFDSVDKKGKIDGFSISGADHWYTLPNHRVRAINNTLAQRSFLPGWLRGVGPGWIGWGVESFMDELAQAAAQDPIEYRLALLDGKGKNAGKSPESVGGATRQAQVLKRVKQQSGWGKHLPANEGLGVATAFGQERTMPTWVACVAHVKVDKKTGKVTVKKLHLTIDCGTVVHPDGALAQAQSSALWGVSLALHEGTRFEQGQVADTNLDRYHPLRMSDVPELDIQFVDSDEFPVGLGEPPLIVVAPAIANAVNAAVGVRVRDLPIRPEAVLKTVLKT